MQHVRNGPRHVRSRRAGGAVRRLDPSHYDVEMQLCLLLFPVRPSAPAAPPTPNLDAMLMPLPILMAYAPEAGSSSSSSCWTTSLTLRGPCELEVTAESLALSYLKHSILALQPTRPSDARELQLPGEGPAGHVLQQTAISSACEQAPGRARLSPQPCSRAATMAGCRSEARGERERSRRRQTLREWPALKEKEPSVR
eukprot:763241-Hanusia_phi.AAC.7